MKSGKINANSFVNKTIGLKHHIICLNPKVCVCPLHFQLKYLFSKVKNNVRKERAV